MLNSLLCLTVSFLTVEKHPDKRHEEWTDEGLISAEPTGENARVCDGIYLMLAAVGEPSRLPVQPVFRAELTATLFTAQTKNTNHTLSG